MRIIVIIALLLTFSLWSITYAYNSSIAQYRDYLPVADTPDSSIGAEEISLNSAIADASNPFDNRTVANNGIAVGATRLTNVSAVVTGDILFVKWRTASEKNNKSFDIEASSDKVHFVTIGEMQSLDDDGNSTAALSYQFSADLAGISLANSGIIVALFTLGSMAMGLSRKVRWAFTGLMITVSLTSATGCTKQSNEAVSETTHTFIRIAQIDRNGSKTYSKIVTVENKN